MYTPRVTISIVPRTCRSACTQYPGWMYYARSVPAFERVADRETECHMGNGAKMIMLHVLHAICILDLELQMVTHSP